MRIAIAGKGWILMWAFIQGFSARSRPRPAVLQRHGDPAWSPELSGRVPAEV